MLKKNCIQICVNGSEYVEKVEINIALQVNCRLLIIYL